MVFQMNILDKKQVFLGGKYYIFWWKILVFVMEKMSGDLYEGGCLLQTVYRICGMHIVFALYSYMLRNIY